MIILLNYQMKIYNLCIYEKDIKYVFLSMPKTIYDKYISIDNYLTSIDCSDNIMNRLKLILSLNGNILEHIQINYLLSNGNMLNENNIKLNNFIRDKLVQLFICYQMKIY
jgi:hypothetical protein